MKDRNTVNLVSPFLFERMVGRDGHKLIQDLKMVYDPHNVLNHDQMVNITKYRNTTLLKRYARENKI